MCTCETGSKCVPPISFTLHLQLGICPLQLSCLSRARGLHAGFLFLKLTPKKRQERQASCRLPGRRGVTLKQHALWCAVLLRSKHPEHMHTRDTRFSIHSSPGITFSRLAQPCLKQTGATVHRVKQGWNKGECIEHSKLFVLLYVNTLTAVMVLFEKSGLCKVQRYL